MTAVIAETSATRRGRAALVPRVVGATASGVMTVAALVGIGLFLVVAGDAALLPGLTEAQRATGLDDLGWNAGVVLSIAVTVQVAMIVATAISVVFILSGPRVTWFNAVLAMTLTAFVATATSAVTGWAVAVPPSAVAVTALTAVASGAFFSLTAVFPTGTFVPRWAVALPLAWGATIAFSLLVPWWEEGPPWAVAVMGALAATLVAGGIVAQVYRYRSVSDRTARQQTKWVLLALVGYLVALLPIFFLPPGALDQLSGGWGVAVQVGRSLIGGILLALVPVSIAVAIAKYRLFDVDLVIRRTLVAVGLVILIGLLYALIVGAAAALWQGSGPIAAVVATVIAALLAHPLRVRLERRATHWLYGGRGDPYGVVSRLGDDLRAMTEPADIGSRVVEVITSDLRYSGASLTCGAPLSLTVQRGDRGARIVATLPLEHDATVIGTLVVRAAPGDGMSAADQRLVSSVAAQAGLALSNASAIAALRTSRERLVVAREEERRRLYRDLHDGLGPAIAGARQRIDIAMRLRTARPDESSRLLAEASEAMTGMLADVRGLVQDLRPRALEELGLAQAIVRSTQPLDTGAGTSIEVSDAPADLPPSVEVAAYRIAVEAITNALRHGEPTRVEAVFALDARQLVVTIDDDGVGIHPSDLPGVGTGSMRERAEELGGRLRITARRSGGTRVQAKLPLPTKEAI